jgi:nucleotide-binding universal stress UspA family protein
MKILVAYDGTLSAKDALRHGLKKVQDNGGEIIALHVFNRELLHYYDATPQVEDRLRWDFKVALDEAESIIRSEGNGVKASIVQFDGNPEREILRFVKEERVDMLLCPKTFTSLAKKYTTIMRERGLEIAPAAQQAPQPTTR